MTFIQRDAIAKLAATNAGKKSPGRKCDMMKDMASVYFNMRTDDLKRLKGEKHMRLLKLRKQVMTYSVQQEIRKLEFQLNRIDAVLNSRFNQGLLFP